jgi:hypothetical protein
MPYPTCHRDSISAKEPRYVAGWLRRVTLTPATAGPLAFIDNKLRDSKDYFKIVLLTRQLHINPDKLTVIQRTLTAKSRLTADLLSLLLPRNLVSNILLNLWHD